MMKHFTRAFSLLVFLTVTTSLRAEPVVICNSSISVASISKTELTRIFTGKSKFVAGKKVIIGALTGSKAGNGDFKAVTDKSVRQFWSTWKRLVFTGKGNMPKKFSSPEELVKFVAATPNAIGFVPQGTATGNAKVLKVE